MTLTYIARMGGKFRLRKKIVSMMPTDYETYVEPFLGGGQVFLELEKEKRKKYVLNDNNRDIYHLWKDLQTISPDAVRSFVFPQSKDLFDRLKQKTDLQDPVERLYRNLYLSLFSFSNNRIAFAKKNKTKGKHILQKIDALQEKLRGVRIYNKDYQDIIQKYNHPETFFYLDPPYTNMEKYYQGQSIDPYELAHVCRTIKGRFLLSYDISPKVKDAFQGFYFQRVRLPYTSGLKSKTKYEYIISNYKP